MLPLGLLSTLNAYVASMTAIGDFATVTDVEAIKITALINFSCCHWKTTESIEGQPDLRGAHRRSRQAAAALVQVRLPLPERRNRPANEPTPIDDSRHRWRKIHLLVPSANR